MISKLKMTQDDLDKLVSVERFIVKPTVFGFGKNDVGFQTIVGVGRVWQYILWASMLERSFSDKYKAKKPTYQDVTCCDEWLSFANFFEWVNREVCYRGKPVGFHLDKDIIIRGNVVYSPETCSFVPICINGLLVDRGALRGDWPLGVCYDRESGLWRAGLRCEGKGRSLGYYSTPEAAFLAYKVAKEARIKLVALQYKDVLKPAVFESLMGWEIQP